MATLLGLVVRGPVGKRRVFESATRVTVAWRIGVLLRGPHSAHLLGKIRKSSVYVSCSRAGSRVERDRERCLLVSIPWPLFQGRWRNDPAGSGPGHDQRHTRAVHEV